VIGTVFQLKIGIMVIFGRVLTLQDGKSRVWANVLMSGLLQDVWEANGTDLHKAAGHGDVNAVMVPPPIVLSTNCALALTMDQSDPTLLGKRSRYQRGRREGPYAVLFCLPVLLPLISR